MQMSESVSDIFRTLFLILALCLLTDSLAHASKQNNPLEDIRQKHNIHGELLDLKNSIDPPRSEWIEFEKELYRSIFKDKQYDVLIVPFQNLARPIALSSRKIITNRMAFELRQRSAINIPPLNLVYRALGNTARYFEDKDVYRLASQLKVKKILWGFIGHYYDKEKKKTMYRISIIREETTPEGRRGESISKSWEGIPVGPDNFPSSAFSSILDEVLNFVGFAEKKTNEEFKNETIAIVDDLKLPENLLKMVRQSDRHPLVQAYYMQLMGLLSPSVCSVELQKDFFIRSLSLLWQADESSPDVKLLKARAYLYLDQRPKAVKLLGYSGTPEAKAFKEFLNANLPAQKTYIQQIKSPVKKLMAQLEQYHLEAVYASAKKRPEIRWVVESVPESWQYLVAQKLMGHDSWSNQSNIPLKAILDKEFPVGGVTMEAHYKSALASGELEQKRMEFEMLFIDHIWEAIRSDETRLFPQSGMDTLSDYDYLVLFQAIGETNLLKYTKFYQHIQGKPETALQLMNAFMPIFQGHPTFHVRKASIIQDLYEQSKSLTDLRKSDLVNQIIKNGFKGLWWIGQDEPKLATYYISQLLNSYEDQIKSGKIPYLKEAFPGALIKTHIRREYPPNRLMLLIHLGFTLEEKLEFIHYDIDDISILTKKRSIQKEYSEEKIVNLKNRFLGNPQWIPLKAKLCKLSGQYEALEEIYKTGINENSLFWDNYEQLGLEYLRKGEYVKARELYMEYLPFTEKDTEYHKVALSNNSYMAGSHFFWRGDHQSARVFYIISAELNTGSGASITSQVRLSLLEQKFGAAADYSQQRAKRYNDPYGFRDYMSLLHVLNQSEPAWSIFDSLIGRFSTPQIWSSAFVGHRTNSTSKAELKSWLNDKKKLVKGRSNNPARFALLSMIDRKPDVSDVDYIGELELSHINLTPNEEHIDQKEIGKKFRYHPVQLMDRVVLNKQVLQAKPPKRYQCIANGYSYLKQKSYDKAFEAFKELSVSMNIMMPAGRQLMPYIVFSAFKSGKTLLAGKMISQEFIDARDYDMILAKAVLAGLQKD
ncbi:MAG: hypothetical protein KJ668_11035, partial [Proteobacteria bacterium]|nr:hypothetical protein [Pseudomonadota bacterium]